MPAPDDLEGAVEAMLRTRAVESPPDARGARRVWHRGARGVELVSVIDAQSQVLGQELRLFEASLRWDAAAGFSPVNEASGRQDTPSITSDVRRLAAALERYSGPDRLIRHLMERLRAHVGPADDAAGRAPAAPRSAQPAALRRAPRLWLAMAVLGLLGALALLVR